WIRRHAPFAADLLGSTAEPYLTFSTRLAGALATEVDAFLEVSSGFDVLGGPRHTDPPPPSSARRVANALRRRQAPAQVPPPPSAGPTAADFYQARFFSPRVNALALQFGVLPEAQRMLSLCCGHGVFENLLRARRGSGEVVSIDGQFLNLLITRRYADHGGTYICHDVQFPFPFRDATFDGVLSSTCLPEIPAQRSFVAEAIRVTTDQGWTSFDSIWNAEVGDQRINPHRFYRFCQNYFASLDDYVPMFESCAGPRRRVGVDIPDDPAAYLGGARWSFGHEIADVLAGRADEEMSVLVVGPDFPGFAASAGGGAPGTPDTAWLRAADLAASWAYDVTRQDDRIVLVRRPEFEVLHPQFAQRRFPGYRAEATIDLTRLDDAAYLTDLFTAAAVSLVPRDYTADPARLLRTPTPGPTAGAPARTGPGPTA
ncbi:MAG: class I SAM-dependent methyltransferase, partial [Acidimicrobiia bacterium]|nr:class I SAM-dependent methyltransferase [Acidimicrobiia bacterium]